MERASREATTNEGRRPPLKVKAKNKVEEVPKEKHTLPPERGFVAIFPPCSEALAGGEANGSLNRCCQGGPEEVIGVEPPRQESSKKAKTSCKSSATEAAPHLKLFVYQGSDKLALKVLSLLPLEVQIAISTFINSGRIVGNPLWSSVSARMSSRNGELDGEGIWNCHQGGAPC